jgi:hypothetical protein
MLDNALRFAVSSTSPITTGFVSGNAYTVNTDALKIGNSSLRGGASGMPIDPMQLIVDCTTAPGTSRPTTVLLNYTVDGGSSWVPLASALIPAVKKGRKVVSCGLDIRPEVYAVANVQFMCTISAPASTNVTNAVLDIYIGAGEVGDF